MSKANGCLVCGELATVESYGYTFCDMHKKYGDIDPETLEPLVTWRLAGMPVKEIEKRLDELL